MAIHWWLASGTYQKMEADVYALQGGSSWEQAVWTPITVRGNEEISLTLSHLLPSFGLLGLGLIPSAIAFLIELIKQSCNKRARKSMTHNEVGLIIVRGGEDSPESDLDQRSDHC